ncbi:MAG TPA: hypothetical protein VLV48_09815 [Thermoanaerobaculia bacterium]|nr:hypothetical protein [Thermoanaerobaculia bacterium]
MASARSHRTPFASISSVALRFVTGGSFSGARAAFDSSLTTNLFRVPIEIRELRIMLDAQPDAAVATGRFDLAPFVNIAAKLGKHHLTDGDVPVSIVAPYRFQQVRSGTGLILDSASRRTIANSAVATVTTRRIHLHEPLILPPGLGFSFVASIPLSAYWTDVFGVSFTANVYVAMIGQFLAPGEKISGMNQIPIISYTEIGSATKKVSFEEELRNPLSVPIRVRRIVGARPVVSANQLHNLVGGRTAQVKLTFPDSAAASEDTINVSSVFGQQRVWPVDLTLPANTRIRASTDTSSSTLRNQIGLYGTRPEVIQ